MQRATILILTNNHFDPTWRRCWDRRICFNGRSFVSYAELEDYYLSDNLVMSRDYPDYAFEAESAVVVRKFLERHPERKEELRKLARDGRFTVAGAGDNIIDTNMVLGESIVRNFLLGLLWVEDNVGVSTRLAVRTDGFGNSAQLPQILRGCGLKWVTGLGYSPVQGKYWRGLDGSTVCSAGLPIVANGSTYWKYPPCPECLGMGCTSCDERGIDLSIRSMIPPDEVDAAALGAFGAGLALIQSEEALPNPGMIDWAKSQREMYDVRFAVQEDAYPWLKDLIEAVDSPDESLVHPSVELNPNNSGVLVSRIKTKQTCRRQEYALLGAEALHALRALRRAAVPRSELVETWQMLLFTMFHDAITATHVDPAYDELKNMWAGIDGRTSSLYQSALAPILESEKGTISVINTLGCDSTQVVRIDIESQAEDAAIVREDGVEAAVVRAERVGEEKMCVEFVASDVPAFGVSVYRVREKAGVSAVSCSTDDPVIENERFRVTADHNGILEILDKASGVIISSAAGFRPGEFVMERDEGSPWATLHPDRAREGVSPKMRLVTIDRGPAHQSMTFECSVISMQSTVGTFCFDARTTVTLYKGIERVDFSSEIDWDAVNVRVRVAMPVGRPGNTIYGIPYGAIERHPYAPQFYNWAGANGDWPAVNWAGVEGQGASLALLNKGLPSYTTEVDARAMQTMFLSILRSPNQPTYLHDPKAYTMTDYDGMRDAGKHRFEYALTAYDAPFSESTVVSDAETYSAGLLAVPGRVNLPNAPKLDSECARISALKWAEKEDALIVRVCEYRGRGGEAVLVLPEGTTSASRVDMLERNAVPLDLDAGAARFSLRPWEIVTLRLGYCEVTD